MNKFLLQKEITGLVNPFMRSSSISIAFLMIFFMVVTVTTALSQSVNEFGVRIVQMKQSPEGDIRLDNARFESLTTELHPNLYIEKEGIKAFGGRAPVCAFVGDAGMEMGLGELATIRELDVPVIICVLVDESLSLIELKQRSSQRKNVGVDFSGTDFVGVANAMGGHGVWIDDVASLEKEAAAALERSNFTVLACRIGRRAYDGTF